MQKRVCTLSYIGNRETLLKQLLRFRKGLEELFQRLSAWEVSRLFALLTSFTAETAFELGVRSRRSGVLFGFQRRALREVEGSAQIVEKADKAVDERLDAADHAKFFWTLSLWPIWMLLLRTRVCTRSRVITSRVRRRETASIYRQGSPLHLSCFFMSSFSYDVLSR